MHFLPDSYVPCDVATGKRYNRETRECATRAQHPEGLEMTVSEAAQLLLRGPPIARKAADAARPSDWAMCGGPVGGPRLGGEAPAVKLSLELSKRDTGARVQPDEPTPAHFPRH